MYVDSGSGSMIISAVVAGAAGAGVVAKMGLRKFTGAFKKDKAENGSAAPTTSTEQQ